MNHTYTSKGMINELNLPRKEPEEWESPAAGMRPYIAQTWQEKESKIVFIHLIRKKHS
jgi:hypothetical protein